MFSLTSFFRVVSIRKNRFLAIYLYVRYQEIVTHKRVFAVVISVSLLGVFSPFLVFLVSRDILLPVVSVLIFRLFLTTVAYVRIYLTVRTLQELDSGPVSERRNRQWRNSTFCLSVYICALFWIIIILLSLLQIIQGL